MTNALVLGGLHPIVRFRAARHIELCATWSIAIGLTQGYRTFEQQQVLHDQGRITPGAIVTNAKPGYSWHNWRLAYDVDILNFPGDTTPRDVYDGPWARVIQIGESLGMLAGGRWKHPDLPHFEEHLGQTLTELLTAHPGGLE